jgi:uracil phosphoribosyltransferase
LGIKKTTEISDQLVISSVLRAGLPLHMGFLNYFDQAENGFCRPLDTTPIMIILK